MASIEEYLKRADELAQQVMNDWGLNFEAGNTASRIDEFRAVFEKACHYRDAKMVADKRRQSNILSEREADEETATRKAFAEAYKAHFEKHFFDLSTQK